MSSVPAWIGLLILIVVIVLIFAWIIMPWKVLGMSDELKKLRKEVEDLKEIQIQQLRELKKMNGHL